MSGLSLTIASWADRDDLVIEIDNGDEQVGLVTYDPLRGKPVIDLYPRSSGEDLRFDLDEMSAVLMLAMERILEIARSRPDDHGAAIQAEAETASVG